MLRYTENHSQALHLKHLQSCLLDHRQNPGLTPIQQHRQHRRSVNRHLRLEGDLSPFPQWVIKSAEEFRSLGYSKCHFLTRATLASAYVNTEVGKRLLDFNLLSSNLDRV